MVRVSWNASADPDCTIETVVAVVHMNGVMIPVSNGQVINIDMNLDDTDVLQVRGEVAHQLDAAGGRASGMGVRFIEVDAENRERLLRFFISDRIRDFYNDRFIVEFPHLEHVVSLKDVALTINLWEDKGDRLAALRGKPGAKKGGRKGRAVAAR